MKQIVWLLLLFSIGVSAQGVYPHQFTEKTTLTDSDWETYSQKSGLPRRISPTTMSAYFLKGVRAYVSGDVLYFSRRDSISSVSLAAYKQTLSVAVNGGGQTTVSISGGNTITLPAASVGDIEVEAPIEGTGSSSDPLGITDLGIATGKIADNAVTYGKIQQVTSSRLIGRYSAGSGTAQEITLGSGLSLSIGGVLSASGGGGGGITALTGDVTASGTGSVAATIANDAVTSAKIASQTVDSLDIKNRSITLPKYARSSVVSTGSITGVVFKGNGSQALPSFDSVLTYLPSTAITDGVSSGFWKTATDRGQQYYSGTTGFLDFHGKNVGGSYANRSLTVGTDAVYNYMSVSSATNPTLLLGVGGTGIGQGLTIDKYGVKNSGAKYESPSADTKTTTYQVSGRNSVEVIANADPTTTITLPEIVTGTPGANQVGIGYIFHLSIDRSVAVTINRAGADLIYVDGVSVTATSVTTTATQYFIRTFRATDANKWEVTAGSGGSGTTISEYNVAVSGANSGSNLRIKATGTGVTASYASNKITVVIPGGTKVFSADWRMVAADIQATGDAAGTTNWVLAEFQGTGGNTGVDDLRVPNIQKTSIPTSGAFSITNSGSIDIDNNPAISVVGAASGNIIIRVGGLSAGGQGYHLKFTEL
jgi:hypothetical protein